MNVGTLPYILAKLDAMTTNPWVWLSIISELNFSQAVSQNAELKTVYIGFHTLHSTLSKPTLLEKAMPNGGTQVH